MHNKYLLCQFYKKMRANLIITATSTITRKIRMPAQTKIIMIYSGMPATSGAMDASTTSETYTEIKMYYLN